MSAIKKSVNSKEKTVENGHGLTKRSIFVLLPAILNGAFAEIRTPKAKSKRKFCWRGKVNSDWTRFFFTANGLFMQAMIEAIADHDCRHRKVTAAPCHCERFERELLLLFLKRKIIGMLMWQSVIEEYPLALVNEVRLVENWGLVCNDKVWQEVTLPFDDSHLAMSFINRISLICSSRCLPSAEVFLPDKCDGERVVGIVDDARVKAFLGLAAELRLSASDSLAKLKPKGCSEESLAPEVRLAMKVVVQHYANLQDLCQLLFWCAVRDTGINYPKMDVRDGWQIVKCSGQGNAVEREHLGPLQHH